MNDDLTKNKKPNLNLTPPTANNPKFDLSSHPDAVEAGLGNRPAGLNDPINIDLADKTDGKNNGPKKPRKNPIQWFKGLTKKQKIIFIVVLILVLGIGGTVSAMLLNKKAPTPAQQQAAQEPAKTTEPSKLTGVEVKPELNKRPVTAVMIENSLDARPQSGLANAGVVFEAIAEGGITRFLVLYQEDKPANIGPVRSVRPYYVDWVQGFDAPIAHAGGSTEALAKIKVEGVKDLDQFFNPAAYRREASRFAPHNLYTSTKNLDQLNKQKGFTKSKFDGFPRKAEDPIKTTEAAESAQKTIKQIDLNISSANFNPHYDYDKKTNSYARSIAGVPHKDLNNNKQIKAKVVVAMVMNYGIAPNGVNSVYNAVGSGKVYIFQDGKVKTGTWEKAGRKKQITFKDANKKTIELNPGSTWISAVGSAASVVYK